MKQLLILIFIGTAGFFTACDKSENAPKPFSDSITGTWELRHTSSAMNPETGRFRAGNGNILKFGISNYEKYEAGQLVKKGDYAIVPDPTVESSVCLLFPVGQFTNRIVYDNDNAAQKQFIEIDKNRLIIVSGCYSIDAGYRLEYEKIAN